MVSVEDKVTWNLSLLAQNFFNGNVGKLTCLRFLMLRITPAFTNYVSSAAAESSYLFRTDRIGQWTWEQKVKRGEHMPNGEIIAAYQ